MARRQCNGVATPTDVKVSPYIRQRAGNTERLGKKKGLLIMTASIKRAGTLPLVSSVRWQLAGLVLRTMVKSIRLLCSPVVDFFPS